MSRDVNSFRSFQSLALHTFLFLLMAYVSKIYHFRLLKEMDYYQDAMPNNSIPVPRPSNRSAFDLCEGLKKAEVKLMEWQEAFYSYRLVLTVNSVCYLMKGSRSVQLICSHI